MTKRVILFDPAAASFNKGDMIISEAVESELVELLPDAEIVKISLHQPLGKIHRSLLREKCLKIVGGSNVVSAVMHPILRQSRWNLYPHDYQAVRGFCYMGAGWAGTNVRSNLIGKWFLKNFPSKLPDVNSFRDSETLMRAGLFGIKNGINTGCPTMWGLTRAKMDAVRRTKGSIVVTTLTDNMPDKRADMELLECLKEQYEEVYIWFQGLNDARYFKSMGLKGVRELPRNVSGYQAFLQENVSRLDYVGSRLHGGVKALQCGVRTIILAVDHRALDISRDVGLLVLPRKDVSSLEGLINSDLQMSVKIDRGAIYKWKQGVLRLFES